MTPKQRKARFAGGRAELLARARATNLARVDPSDLIVAAARQCSGMVVWFRPKRERRDDGGRGYVMAHGTRVEVIGGAYLGLQRAREASDIDQIIFETEMNIDVQKIEEGRARWRRKMAADQARLEATKGKKA